MNIQYLFYAIKKVLIKLIYLQSLSSNVELSQFLNFSRFLLIIIYQISATSRNFSSETSGKKIFFLRLQISQNCYIVLNIRIMIREKIYGVAFFLSRQREKR